MPPLALKIPKIPVASVEKAVEVQFATLGGEGTPTFALTKGYEGLSIDAVHGNVTIDLPKIWKQYLAGGAEPATPFAFYVQPAVATAGVRGDLPAADRHAATSGQDGAPTALAGRGDERGGRVRRIAVVGDRSRSAGWHRQSRRQAAGRESGAEAAAERSLDEVRAQARAAAQKDAGGEILGLWACVKCSDNGIPDRNAEETLAVFTADRVQIARISIREIFTSTVSIRRRLPSGATW